MKHLVGIVLVALLLCNFWLLLNQVRIERRLQALQAENQKLAEEMAQRPPISAEDFRMAQAQFERARGDVEAVENRLTNATAVLDSLRQAAAAHNQGNVGPFRNARTGRGDAGPSGNEFSGNRSNIDPAPEGIAFAAGPPSSSHSPDGQL